MLIAILYSMLLNMPGSDAVLHMSRIVCYHMGEQLQRIFLICIRFNSCEVQRLNLALITMQTSLYIFMPYIYHAYIQKFTENSIDLAGYGILPSRAQKKWFWMIVKNSKTTNYSSDLWCIAVSNVFGIGYVSFLVFFKNIIIHLK